MRGSVETCLIALMVASLVSCEGEPACLDNDFDGYGEHCPNGPDCDDTNVARNVDCDAVPAPDCRSTPIATGCPCLLGAATDCYSGAEGTEGIGICHAGEAHCVNSHWYRCEGAVLPRFEVCDGQDQDCDGIVDDGVLSPCGGCSHTCNGGVWGEGDAPFEVQNGLALDVRGRLTLARRERVASSTVWIANSADGTVSKIDALTAREVARYDSGGSEPSRVAVDHKGDGWVANRAFDGQSTVTKIAGALERCRDRDGDGIETSTGPTHILPAGEDECILFTIPVGGNRAVARALAIDGDLGLDGISGGNAWIGMHDGMEVVVVDGFDGTVRTQISTPGFHPYGAVFDAWGTLWLLERDGHLARIDSHATVPTAEIIEAPISCYLFYSLAVDDDGRVFVTGFSCDDIVAYDPDTTRWTTLAAPASPRGIIAWRGELWAVHTGAQLSRLTASPFELVDTYDLVTSDASPTDSIGIGIDGLGALWVASERGGAFGSGVVTRFDPAMNMVTAHISVGTAPHTQGDLTGSQLTSEFAEQGTTGYVFAGCPDFPDETEWMRLHVNVLPGGGTVEIAVRHAASRELLSGASFTVLGVTPFDEPPFALSFPVGGVVEARLTLARERSDGAPRVERVGLEWTCPGVG